MARVHRSAHVQTRLYYRYHPRYWPESGLTVDSFVMQLCSLISNDFWTRNPFLHTMQVASLFDIELRRWPLYLLPTKFASFTGVWSHVGSIARDECGSEISSSIVLAGFKYASWHASTSLTETTCSKPKFRSFLIWSAISPFSVKLSHSRTKVRSWSSVMNRRRIASIISLKG